MNSVFGSCSGHFSPGCLDLGAWSGGRLQVAQQIPIRFRV